MSTNATEILPTPFQTGEIIVDALLTFPYANLVGEHKANLFIDASITKNDYINEMFLLSVSAAIYVVKTSTMSDDSEEQISLGMKSKLESTDSEMSIFTLKNIKEVYPYYLEAIEEDLASDGNDITEIELAFGDRLFFYGEESDKRGNACAHLSMAVPKVLWEAQFNSTCSTLDWAGVLQKQ